MWSASKGGYLYHKILKPAAGEGVLLSLPPRGSVPREDNPRPFFRFYPLVREEADEVVKLRRCASELAEEGVRVRGTIITDELLEFIDFMLGSFLRPTIGEVFSLRQRHVSVLSDDPARLIQGQDRLSRGHHVAKVRPRI